MVERKEHLELLSLPVGSFLNSKVDGMEETTSCQPAVKKDIEILRKSGMKQWRFHQVYRHSSFFSAFPNLE